MTRYEITHYSLETPKMDTAPTAQEINAIVMAARGFAGGDPVGEYDNYSDACGAVEQLPYNNGYRTYQTNAGWRGLIEWFDIDRVEYDDDGDATKIETIETYYNDEHHTRSEKVL